MTIKLSDPKQFNWEAAQSAASEIVKICQNAGFTAPEDLEVHQVHIVRVCEQLNAIVAALCIRGPGNAT